ncbi:MAG: hypothetical protein R3B07_11515 [Polyangiaceae bacterium]
MRQAFVVVVLSSAAGCSGQMTNPPGVLQTGGTGGVSGSNSGGTAGTGSSAGSASGGSAGFGGEGNTSTTCPSDVKLIDEDQIARAAMVNLSCYGDDGYRATQEQMRRVAGGWVIPESMTQCLAAVTGGCDEALACAGFSKSQPGDVVGICSGDMMVVSGEGGLRIDCTKWEATCVTGKCQGGDWDSCDSETTPDTCTDGRPVACEKKLQTGPKCSDYGLSCEFVDDSFSQYTVCKGQGAACETESSTNDLAYTGLACNGSQLSACVHGAEAMLECSCQGQGFGCQSAGGAFFCGRASECDPATFESYCDGGDVVMCNAGKVTRLACSASGFAQCTVRSYGAVCQN